MRYEDIPHLSTRFHSWRCGNSKVAIQGDAIMRGEHLVCDGTSGNLALEEAMAHAMSKWFYTWKRKHRDYGADNIAAEGKLGVLVRIGDKVRRLKNLIIFWGTLASNEPSRDTWGDIAMYGFIGLLLDQGKWPAPSPELEEMSAEIEAIKEKYNAKKS